MAKDEKAASGASSGGSSADAAPTKQYYRFRVQTADGKEMTSAVAEVDLEADGDLENDPKSDDEAVQKRHDKEQKEHAKQSDDFHDSEHAKDMDDLDKDHNEQADT